MSDHLVVLAIIIISITIFPFIGDKARIPAIVLELIAGIIFGMNGLIPIVSVEAGDWLDFLSSLGFIFLMFLAGLEINSDKLKKNFRSSSILAITSFTFCFIIGIFCGFILNLDLLGQLFLGLVFSCTSIGIVFPTLRELGLSKDKMGQITITATIILDIVGLATLSILIGLSGANNSSFFAILIIQILVITFLFVGSIFFAKKVWRWIDKKFPRISVLEWEVRISLTIIFSLSVIFLILGMEAIIGAFIAGLIMGESKYAEKDLEDKVGAVGYGFLIPIFFFVIGTRTNLRVFLSIENLNLIIFASILIIIAILSKIISSTIGGKLIGFSTKESIVIGSSMIARLSIGLAVAKIGFTLEIFDDIVFTIIVLTAIITSFLTPILTKFSAFKLIPKKVTLTKCAIRKEYMRHMGIVFEEEHHEHLTFFHDHYVKDFMSSDVVVIKSDMALRDLIKILERIKHNSYPIVDENDNLIAMISLKEIEEALVQNNLDLEIENCCTNGLHCFTPHENLGKAFDLMIEKDIHSICVVDPINESELMGIVSITDIMRGLRLDLLKKGENGINIK